LCFLVYGFLEYHASGYVKIGQISYRPKGVVMKSTIRNIFISAIISIASLFFTIPVSAEDVRETAKYKAPNMDQTIGFIQEMTLDNVGFEPEQCILTNKVVINNYTYEYITTLKEINPSPGHVKPRLNCVVLTVDGFKKKIKRIGRDGKEEWKSKVDVCTANKESAEKLANAMRYLISICGGQTCVGCNPFPWEKR